MFNNTTYNNSVNIKPACSGMLQQSHPKAFFLRFHKNSKMADWVFDTSPCLKRLNRYNDYDKYMDVVVLQVMCFGDEEFLCELIDKNEFETAEI